MFSITLQRSIQISANQPKLDTLLYSICNVRPPTANVRSDGHSFPRSNTDVQATDRQRRRSLSLKFTWKRRRQTSNVH